MARAGEAAPETAHVEGSVDAALVGRTEYAAGGGPGSGRADFRGRHVVEFVDDFGGVGGSVNVIRAGNQALRLMNEVVHVDGRAVLRVFALCDGERADDVETRGGDGDVQVGGRILGAALFVRLQKAACIRAKFAIETRFRCVFREGIDIRGVLLREAEVHFVAVVTEDQRLTVRDGGRRGIER